eukprot:1157796-Pelagomonas_calceolata.AAC.4
MKNISDIQYRNYHGHHGRLSAYNPDTDFLNNAIRRWLISIWPTCKNHQQTHLAIPSNISRIHSYAVLDLFAQQHKNNASACHNLHHAYASAIR